MTSLTSASSPTAPHQLQPREIAPFLKSLRAMLDDESQAVLSWTPDGRAFEIRDVQALTKSILPKYFKHAKYASFQRQLNYFNFRKWTKSRTEVCTFANPYFQRDEPHLSWRILRKRSISDMASNAPRASSSRSASSSPISISVSSAAASTASSSDDSASSPCDSPQADSELDVALDWIDAVFPSLEMLCALGQDTTNETDKPTRIGSPPRRRNAPMPPQSYEFVSW